MLDDAAVPHIGLNENEAADWEKVKCHLSSYNARQFFN